MRGRAILASRDLVISTNVDELAEDAHYEKSPYHDPNASPWRPDKTECPPDFDCAHAQSLLIAGLRRGLFSTQQRGGWPQEVWAVDGNGNAYEAQLTNRGNGQYHGYPMQAADRFAGFITEQ